MNFSPLLTPEIFSNSVSPWPITYKGSLSRSPNPQNQKADFWGEFKFEFSTVVDPRNFFKFGLPVADYLYGVTFPLSIKLRLQWRVFASRKRIRAPEGGYNEREKRKRIREAKANSRCLVTINAKSESEFATRKRIRVAWLQWGEFVGESDSPF